MNLWNVVLSGYPGSGKTTLAKRLVKDYRNFARISVDDLRSMLFGEVYPCRDERLLYKTLARMRDIMLENNFSPIIDSTAPNDVTREYLLYTKKDVNRLLIVFNVKREILIKRNRRLGHEDIVKIWDLGWQTPRINIPKFTFINNRRDEFALQYELLTELLESPIHPFEHRNNPLTYYREVGTRFSGFLKNMLK